MNTWALDVDINPSVRNGVNIVLRDGQGGEDIGLGAIKVGPRHHRARPCCVPAIFSPIWRVDGTVLPFRL